MYLTTNGPKDQIIPANNTTGTAILGFFSINISRYLVVNRFVTTGNYLAVTPESDELFQSDLFFKTAKTDMGKIISKKKLKLVKEKGKINLKVTRPNDVEQSSNDKCGRQSKTNINYSYKKVAFNTYKTLQEHEESKSDTENKDFVSFVDGISEQMVQGNHVILFVFGITGSGKDNFLNSVYGCKNLLNNPNIGSDDDRYDIDTILNDTNNFNGYKLEEDWYYIDKDYKMGKASFTPKNVGNRNVVFQKVKDFMKTPSPFNPDSTRGFNIKTFTKYSDESKKTVSHKVTIINVPGFEPLTSILQYAMTDIKKGKENIYSYPIQFTESNLKYTKQFNDMLSYLIQHNEKDIEQSDGFTRTGNQITPGELNAPKTKKTFEELQEAATRTTQPQYKVNRLIYQSLFIISTLTLMTVLIVNYKNYKTLPVDDIPSYILKELIEEDVFLNKMEVSEKVYEPKDYKAFIPFNKSSENKKPQDPQKYTKVQIKTFKGKEDESNNKIQLYYNKNDFIKELSNLLFSNDDKLIKIRFNINVVRPLRTGTNTTKTTNVIDITKLDTKKETKLVLDNTLVQTLQGFCEISGADTE